MDTPPSDSTAYEAPFRHFVAHRTMLKAYVMAIVRDPHLAEDAVSDTAVEITRCWADFDQTRPFPNWARGVARRIGLALLRKNGRTLPLFNAELLEGLGDDLDHLGAEAELEQRKRMLRECLDKLPSGSRSLVEMRYFNNRAYEDIATATKRTLNALYIAFSRIHGQLSTCISRGSGSP